MVKIMRSHQWQQLFVSPLCMHAWFCLTLTFMLDACLSTMSKNKHFQVSHYWKVSHTSCQRDVRMCSVHVIPSITCKSHRGYLLNFDCVPPSAGWMFQTWGGWLRHPVPCTVQSIRNAPQILTEYYGWLHACLIIKIYSNGEGPIW